MKFFAVLSVIAALLTALIVCRPVQIQFINKRELNNELVTSTIEWMLDDFGSKICKPDIDCIEMLHSRYQAAHNVELSAAGSFVPSQSHRVMIGCLVVLVWILTGALLIIRAQLLKLHMLLVTVTLLKDSTGTETATTGQNGDATTASIYTRTSLVKQKTNREQLRQIQKTLRDVPRSVVDLLINDGRFKAWLVGVVKEVLQSERSEHGRN